MSTAIKERPILFSGAMVRALLAGTKTQTRRTTGLDFINENPGCWQRQWVPAKDGKHWLFTCGDDRVQVRCPYGVEEERLWVREQHLFNGAVTESGKKDFQVRHIATNDDRWMPGPVDFCPRWEQLRPSIHMPRWASRILLEIVSVRVERLQDLSEVDAIAEGVHLYASDTEQYPAGWHNCYQDYINTRNAWMYAKHSFRTLWDSINGKDEAKEWKANPWVWVVEFKRINE